MCINCNEPVHLFCAEYLIDQMPVAEETSYISVKGFTKEGKARWKKTSSADKDDVAFCILCSAKMKAVKILVEANGPKKMGMPNCDEDFERLRLLRGVINLYKIFNWTIMIYKQASEYSQ